MFFIIGNIILSMCVVIAVSFDKLIPKTLLVILTIMFVAAIIATNTGMGCVTGEEIYMNDDHVHICSVVGSNVARSTLNSIYLSNDMGKNGAVVMHELGHVRMHHYVADLLLKITAYVVILAILFHYMFKQIYLKPMLFVMCLGLLFMYVISSVSIYMEYEADNYAVSHGYGQQLYDTLHKYDEVSGGNILTRSHPTNKDRMDNIIRYSEEHATVK